MARRFILAMALITALSLGFGWLTEDLCAAGGSYADDPSSPVSMAQYALPTRLQSAHKTGVAVFILAPRASGVELALHHSSEMAAPSQPSAPPDTPRRC